MPFNGSGSFSVYTPGTPYVTGTTISSTVANAVNSDFATGLSTAICKDGQTTVTANLPMAGFKHTGVGTATATTQYARADQVENSSLTVLGGVSGADTITATAAITLGAYAAGQFFRFTSAGANTGAVTINIDSLGAKAVTKLGSTALAAGDIPSGAVVTIGYDGTQFQLIGLAAAFATTATTATSATTATKSTNLAGGLGGQIPYQSAVDTTALLANGTARQVLQSQAGTAAPVWGDLIVLGTPQATTSGTSIDSPSIPASAKQIIVSFDQVSTNGASTLMIQLSDAGGPENSGYNGSASRISTTVVTQNHTTGFLLLGGAAAASSTYSGKVVFDLQDASTFTWSMTSSIGESGALLQLAAGSKSLSAALTGLRLTTEGGVNTFDGGAITVSYQ